MKMILLFIDIENFFRKQSKNSAAAAGKITIIFKKKKKLPINNLLLAFSFIGLRSASSLAMCSTSLTAAVLQCVQRWLAVKLRLKVEL